MKKDHCRLSNSTDSGADNSHRRKKNTFSCFI